MSEREKERERKREGEREKVTEREERRDRDSPWGADLVMVDVCCYSISHSLPPLLSYFNSHDIQSP